MWKAQLSSKGRIDGTLQRGLTSSHSLRWFLLPSIGNIVFVSLFVILGISSAQGLLGDGDTAYHIRTGELILDTLKVPTHDPYSFHSPVLPWTAHEWLSEIIMALIFRMAGLTGIVIFFSFLLSFTHWLLFYSLRSRFEDIASCLLVTLIATASSSIHWLARPHVFSLLFVVIWNYLLDRFQDKGDQRIKYLPLLMIVWVNLHGGFIVGIVLIAIYLVGNICYAIVGGKSNRNAPHKAKSLILVLFGTIAASCINPFGYEILAFPFRVASDRFIADHVIEFLSPNFHDPIVFKYMLLAFIGVLALSRLPLTIIETALALLLSYMALYSARHISLFAIILAPILVKSCQAVLHRLPERFLTAYRRRIQNLAHIDGSVKGYTWPFVGVVGVLLVTFIGESYTFSKEKFPIKAVEFLQQNPISGRMFNNDEFGDYLIFAAWPAYQVFMDGRSDMYQEKIGRDYLRAAHGLPGWKNVLERYDITWVFFDTKSPLTALLEQQSEWHPIYSDPMATIFVQRIPQHSHLIVKFPSVSVAH